MLRPHRHPAVTVIRLAACLVLLSLAAVGQAMQPLAATVGSVGIPVRDLDRSTAFYRDVLTFIEEERSEVSGDDYDHLFGVFGTRLRTARMRLGDERIVLMQFVTPPGRPIPEDSRSNDRWFQHIAIIVRDMQETYARLRRHRVPHASPGPQRLPDWNPNAGGIEAFYFRDPDGNHLEVLAFPPGKGDPRWHRPGNEPFLGIDHTAIVVGDTDASLAFYRDVLGLRVVGESENFGPEQERLNNVFGAHLRITALRAAAGPGVELLEYLSPQGGRAMPADSRPTDRWHWQIDLTTADADAAYRDLRSRRQTIVSPTVVDLTDGALGFRRGLLVRDPDGHALMIQQR